MPDLKYRLDAGSPKQKVEETNRLLKAVSDMQIQFMRESDRHLQFVQMIRTFLNVTNSGLGSLGSVHCNADGSVQIDPGTVSYTASDSSWIASSDSKASTDSTFQVISTLVEETLHTGNPFSWNTPEEFARSGINPLEHPALDSLIAIPLKLNDRHVGVLGLANRTRGYGISLADWLEPLSTTCATLMSVAKSDQSNSALQHLQGGEQWRTVIQNVPDFILVVGREGQIHFLNHVREGYDQKQVYQTTIYDYQPAESHDTVRDAMRRVFDKGESVSYETVGRGKPDEWRTYSCRLIPNENFSGPPTALMIATDVTEERAARESEARHFGILKAITEGTSELIFAKDLNSRPVFVNEAIARVHGTTAEKMIGQTEEDHFSEPSYKKILTDDQRIIQSGISETYEEVLSLKSGERNFLTTKCPWRDRHGNIVGIIGVAKDITEWKETQNALHQSREHLRAIIESTPGCVKLVAQDGTLLEVNAAGVQMAEADVAGCIIGTNVFDLVASEYRPAFIRFHERVCGGFSGSMQFEIIGLKGTRRWVETHAVPLPLGTDGNVVHLAVTHDITATRVAEETIAAQQSQLIHVSRLSSMGQMVAVLSHEITQPLAAIANFASACTLLTEKSTPDIQKLREYLSLITEQSARAGQILGRVRNFVKRSDEHRVECELLQLVKDSLTLTRADLRSRQVMIESNFPDRLSTVFADPVQIQQVIVNLISNACDAVESQPIGQRKIWISVADSEDQVTVKVLDSGPGLADDILTQLFDPFYTSKASGMGMGLTICSDIIKSHSGIITAENVPSYGAEFRFTLPHSKEVNNE